MTRSSQDIKSPGDLVRHLLATRGWTQDDLASIMDLSRQSISGIIAGRTALTPETAKALSLAFDNTFAEWWMLEGTYRESLLGQSEPESIRRASLIKLAPIKDMQRRGWLSPDKSLDELEPELKAFYGTDDLEKDFELPVLFRRTLSDGHLNRAEIAWTMRAIHLAGMVPAQAFREERLPRLETDLRRLAAKSKAVHKVAEVLSNYGIRFVVVEPLPRAKIDGAAFWLSESSPVIALSIRFDNIGSFWFTLMHEFLHIKHRDSFSLDRDIETTSDLLPAFEQRANQEAADILVPQDRLETFIRTFSPYFSESRINDLATELQIHPGIIVGQLQHRSEIGYQAHHKLMVKVRELTTYTAFTDGWGHPVPRVRMTKEAR